MTFNETAVKKVYPDGTVTDSISRCICEHRLIIRINDTPLYTLVCTGDSTEELIVGRLFTDGIIDSYDNIISLSFSDDMHCADVTVKDKISEKRAHALCDTINAPVTEKPLKRLQKRMPDTKTVFDIIALFSDDGRLHKTTGGTHRCIAYHDTDTPEYAAFEDISRHNAVDKAVGHLLMKGFPSSECILFTSGRVPLDMTKKVIAAGIPILITKSVPTVDSVHLADEYGLTLICKAWKDSFEIYGSTSG